MIPWLDPTKPPFFPDTRDALEEPNGLLAAGGKLTIDWLLAAYRQGIFPWFSENDPILWWTPTPRTVLLPEYFHSSKSLKKLQRQQRFHITQNLSFSQVIHHCSLPRKTQDETWIVDDMIEAYVALFEAGLAQSFECRDDNEKLVGGVYGVSIGRVFFGESMYSAVPNASKLCLKHIAECGEFDLIDCQMTTSHLSSLGAIEINRDAFESALNKLS